MDKIILHFFWRRNWGLEKISDLLWSQLVCFRVRIPSPLHHSCFSMTKENCLLQAPLATCLVVLNDWQRPRKFLLCNCYENQALDSWNRNLITEGCDRSYHKDYVLYTGAHGVGCFSHVGTAQPAQLCLVAALEEKSCRRHGQLHICEIFFGSSQGPCLEEYISKIYAQASIDGEHKCSFYSVRYLTLCYLN